MCMAHGAFARCPVVLLHRKAEDTMSIDGWFHPGLAG